MTVLFDEALRIATLAATQLASQAGSPVYIVRDLLGRCRLVVDDRERAVGAGLLDDFDALLRNQLEAYAPEGKAAVSTAALFDAADQLERSSYVTVGGPGTDVRLVERTLMGDTWIQPLDATAVSNRAHRVALYSIKGGVGRTTAAAVLAAELAASGQCVLVVDLDLESPGIGSLLLDEGALPDLGLVDQLVESNVGNDVAADCIARWRDLPVSGFGEVWVSPARGLVRPGYTYLPKLDRAYLDLSSGSQLGSFAARLLGAIHALELAVAHRSSRPSVVLLDCRAGMHDVAGVALTTAADTALLFAADTEQTWWGYGALFAQWSERPDLARRIRERLRMVASQVDVSHADEYLAAFVDRSASLFEVLYDQAAPDDDAAFSPQLLDSSAPHYPLPIFFDERLRHVDRDSLRSAVAMDFIRSSYSSFLSSVLDLVGE